MRRTPKTVKPPKPPRVPREPKVVETPSEPNEALEPEVPKISTPIRILRFLAAKAGVRFGFLETKEDLIQKIEGLGESPDPIVRDPDSLWVFSTAQGGTISADDPEGNWKASLSPEGRWAITKAGLPNFLNRTTRVFEDQTIEGTDLDEFVERITAFLYGADPRLEADYEAALKAREIELEDLENQSFEDAHPPSEQDLENERIIKAARTIAGCPDALNVFGALLKLAEYFSLPLGVAELQEDGTSLQKPFTEEAIKASVLKALDNAEKAA